jgi:hypothetical protein
MNDTPYYVMFGGSMFHFSEKITKNMAFWCMRDGRMIKFSLDRPPRIICERFLKVLDKPLSKDYLKDYEKLFKVL